MLEFISKYHVYVFISILLIFAGAFGLLYRVLGVNDPSVTDTIQDIVKVLVGILVGRLSGDVEK